MKYAIISDIHSNIEAFCAICKELIYQDTDSVVCLGDIVGYNPDPDACTNLVFKTADNIIRGNHDKAVVGCTDIHNFNCAAQEAILWTKKNLTEKNIARLKNLNQGPIVINDKFLICHGSLMDKIAIFILLLVSMRASHLWLKIIQI